MSSIITTDRSVSPEARVAQAVDEFLARRAAGDNPSISDFVECYPDIAAVLPDVLGALDALAHIDLAQDELPFPLDEGGESRNGESSPRKNILGDYRIIRELGRGGMGIVYEAEQISLSRRVALKILPFAAVLDPRHLQRFKNEALAAAHLDHPNIVEVYGVGCERGVHFYAMRYVEGQTLAAVIDAMRVRGSGFPSGLSLRVEDRVQEDSVGNALGGVPEPPCATAGLSSSADSILTTDRSLPAAAGSPTTPPDTVAAALSTLRTTRPKDYFRRIAELGIQAAEALDHAHQMGIVHRDIKPSNLMLDERGKLWITDFGLAHVESDASLTMTGDLLGTLRYMSPEQALAKRVTVDHRTDIYSLGVTLYEWLTLRPAYAGEDREELLRQIAFQDPPSVRRLNPGVPLDMETIVHKAMAKNPDERYTTAGELAGDLRCVLNQQSIKARRPSLFDRARRWMGRHAAMVTSAIVALSLIAGSGIAAAVLIGRAWQSETEHRAKAEDNLELAKANLLLASASIDRMLSTVANQSYLRGDVQHAERLAQNATSFYEQLLQKSDNVALTFRAAKAYQQVAHIQIAVAQHEKASAAYKRSAELLAPLVGDHPEQPDYLEALAATETGNGEILWRLERFADAEGPLRRAAEISERLAKSFSDEKYQLGLADRLNNLGLVYWDRNKPEEAEKCYQRSAEVLRSMPAELRNSPLGWERQSCLLVNWGMLARDLKQYDRALAMFDDAASGQGAVLALEPAHPRNRVESYNLLWNVAETYVCADRFEKAAQAVEKMVAAYPNSLQANHEGAEFLLRCAEQCSHLAPQDETSTAGNAATQTVLPPGEGSKRGSETNAGNQPRATGSASVDLATASDRFVHRARELVDKAHTATGRNSDSTERFARFLLTVNEESFCDPERAVALANEALKSTPQRPLGWHTFALANYRLGRWQAAETALQKCIEYRPGRKSIAYDWVLLSLVCFQQHRTAEAQQWHDKAKQWNAENPDSDSHFIELLEEAAALSASPAAQEAPSAAETTR